MSAHVSRKFAILLVAVGVAFGCSSSGSSTASARWPWTKKPSHEDGKRQDDVLGTPPAPKHAKAGVKKPSVNPANDTSNVTLRSPRIIDDREINRAAR